MSLTLQRQVLFYPGSFVRSTLFINFRASQMTKELSHLSVISDQFLDYVIAVLQLQRLYMVYHEMRLQLGMLNMGLLWGGCCGLFEVTAPEYAWRKPRKTWISIMTFLTKFWSIVCVTCNNTVKLHLALFVAMYKNNLCYKNSFKICLFIQFSYDVSTAEDI